MRFVSFAIGILFLPLSVGAISFQEVAQYTPGGYVSDLGEMLDSDTALEDQLAELNRETSVEFAVVTIDSLPPNHTIETFATELFTEWGIGNAERDTGLLLLISRNDRKFRLETGYGLEGAIPDLLAKQIAEAKLIPAFKANDYDRGVSTTIAAVQEILLDDTGLVAEQYSGSSENADGFRFFLLGLMGWFLSIGILTGVWQILGFGIATIVAWLLAGFLGIFLFWFFWLIWFIIAHGEGGGGGGGSGGYRGGGFSSGGSSFGGFSGGMSGGGGFSGSW